MMARNGDVDFSELRKFTSHLKSGEDKIQLLIETLAKELGAELIAKAKKRTPADTGNLRRNWSISGVEKVGDVYRITVYNNTEYAAYVEYGHRTSDNKGWVHGKFMMTISAKEIDSKAPKYIQKRVKAFVNEVLKSG